ncbi:hypothetical protein E2C01_028756 [Portunus trituberculatus]|uniref:Uncharacterized protein n=1 Tax=Portunus trituberculatus TaxID=210409 RepID=A0A5B7EPK5_PORTR|nr:hypothetical protein [Portunus trituberculatus]
MFKSYALPTKQGTGHCSPSSHNRLYPRSLITLSSYPSLSPPPHHLPYPAAHVSFPPLTRPSRRSSLIGSRDYYLEGFPKWWRERGSLTCTHANTHSAPLRYIANLNPPRACRGHEGAWVL